MKEKDELRQIYKQRRDCIARLEKEIMDESIFNNLVKDLRYINAEKLFIFVSFKNEVNTHRIIEDAISKGKEVFVPKVISKMEGMKAVKIKSFQDLEPGTLGILEPKEDALVIEPSLIDLVILPGLAFDKYGGRLGYGGGYYDRFLYDVKSSTLMIGIAYNFQLTDRVPMTEHDIRVNIVITEEQTITVSQG